MSSLRDATADELRALLEGLLEEKAREQGLQIPDPQKEGKELHDEKNAPWVNGMYSRLKFPKYEHREFPKMLFNAKFVEAARQYETVCRMRVTQQQQQDYVVWLADAQRAKDEATLVVRTQADMDRAWSEGWRESPDAAVEFDREIKMEIATAAAEAAYQDRNLSERAKAEREAYDATLDEHLVEVPSAKERKRKKDEATAVGA